MVGWHMKAFNFSIGFLLAVFPILSSCQKSEPKLIDIKRFLIAACFEDSIFIGSQNIGTVEEFIDFSFYNTYPSYCNEEGKKAILEELPMNKIGVLKICSMWSLKIASDPLNKEIYFKRIRSIVEKAKTESEVSASGYGNYKIPAITVTDAEIHDFYQKALKNRLAEMEIKGLGNVGSKQIKDFVYDYCIDNTPQNANMARKYIAQLSKNDPALSDAIDAFLIDLHPGLFELFTGKKYTPPNEIYPR
jgi:hypothetical protein